MSDLAKHDFFVRFQDVVPIDRLNSLSYHIVGCGSIGSQIALMLHKMGTNYIHLWDYDTVSDENIGTQGFSTRSLGMPKVDALYDILTFYHESPGNITRHNSKFKLSEFRASSLQEPPSVVFLAVDNMEARQLISSSLSKRPDSIFIVDTRMTAEQINIFSFTPAKLDEYKKTLFSDDEAFQERCTAKSTIYTANLAAALAISSFKYWYFNEVTPNRVDFNESSSYYTNFFTWSIHTNRIRDYAPA